MHATTASQEIQDRAAKGPHRGWDTFDLGLEGARFQLLHEAVVAAPFDTAAAEHALSELDGLAQSCGYADADSHLHEYGGDYEEGSEQAICAEISRAAVFDDPGESSYFSEVYKSEKTLFAAAATREARNFLSAETFGTVYRVMMTAYERGRDMKADEAKPSAAPSPAS